MKHSLPETKEQYSSHIPALKTLLASGWQYLSASDCLKKRSSNREVVLKDELIGFLQQHRFDYKGQSLHFPLMLSNRSYANCHPPV